MKLTFRQIDIHFFSPVNGLMILNRIFKSDKSRQQTHTHTRKLTTINYGVFFKAQKSPISLLW